MIRAQTAEGIEFNFGMLVTLDPSDHVLDGHPNPPRNRGVRLIMSRMQQVKDVASWTQNRSKVAASSRMP